MPCTLGRSRADRIVVVGHPMGAQVVIEALRQMALTGAPAFFGKLYAVVLMAPDVDVDFFHSEVRPLAGMDIPWFIFISSRDRALRMSSLARGQREQLGSLSDLEGIADLDVAVVDLSGVDSIDRLGHQTVAQSPVMISLIQGLGAYGPVILEDEAASSASWRRPFRRSSRRPPSSSSHWRPSAHSPITSPSRRLSAAPTSMPSRIRIACRPEFRSAASASSPSVARSAIIASAPSPAST